MRSYFQERFGIPPEDLAEHRLFRRGEHICALRADAEPAADELSVFQAGLKILKVTGHGGFKPTSRGLQVFGAHALKNVVDLEPAELRRIVQGGSQSCPGLKGFVLLRTGARVVGVGLVREEQLVSQLPRGVTEHLRLPSD